MKSRFAAAGAALAMGLAGAGAAPSIPAQYTATKVNLNANDLAFNAGTGEYLVSLGSLAGPGLGNTLTRIGGDGSILSSQFVGSEPGRIAVSADGSLGYVALRGAAMVARFDGSTGAFLNQFTLGSTWSGANYAEDLAVSPDNKQWLAVALRNSCCSPRHEGVALFVDGVKSGNQTAGHTGSNSIAFGAHGGTLYGYNNETTEFGLRTMSVSNAGITVVDIDHPQWNFYSRIWYDGGRVISSQGRVFDPNLGVQVGQFMLAQDDSFATDAARGVAYTLGRSGTLTVFDFQTFVPLTSFSLGGVLNDWYGYHDLVVGADGDLAALGASGGVYLLAAAVPEMPTYLLMGLGLLAIGRTRRVAKTLR